MRWNTWFDDGVSSTSRGICITWGRIILYVVWLSIVNGCICSYSPGMEIPYRTELLKVELFLSNPNRVSIPKLKLPRVSQTFL
jgi:hypothetical protein